MYAIQSIYLDCQQSRKTPPLTNSVPCHTAPWFITWGISCVGRQRAVCVWERARQLPFGRLMARAGWRQWAVLLYCFFSTFWFLSASSHSSASPYLVLKCKPPIPSSVSSHPSHLSLLPCYSSILVFSSKVHHSPLEWRGKKLYLDFEWELSTQKTLISSLFLQPIRTVDSLSLKVKLSCSAAAKTRQKRWRGQDKNGSFSNECPPSMNQLHIAPHLTKGHMQARTHGRTCSTLTYTCWHWVSLMTHEH